ncbi:serine-type D-Ala-D-Ala carboxypeptidase [Photobacterium galatheae]|uniref:D-alanyl-D-alanine carboxypeptidase n=1 Tax=Photobacterium galatheae TaxID=1654360 RepID=A0A066RJ85_9GAMM|nr:serine-type D-Ala-D-Ala carboxypeptidase [Photobacterium galatheae]KDM90500.1 D-alanyl-D-alanine carboxypeptidase [Photobacterium galatheae]MCM0147778.1 serine-type D-Ala-D-Ala carboxypeptidase [Photobacterium galatheae]
MKKITGFLLASLTFSHPVWADFSPGPAIEALPQGHDLALIITDPSSGTTVFSQRAEQLQAPASTQKLLTALAAKLYLGNDFRFTTQIEQQDQDFIFRFSGDPTLSRSDLTAMLQQLKSKGVRRITGNIYLNGSQFTGYEQAPGWPWDSLGVCYSAPSSSITLEHNCVQAALYSDQSLGQFTRLHVPSHQPITATSRAKVVSKAQQKTEFCALELQTQPGNHYQLSGCLPQRDKPLPLNFAVVDTEAYVRNVLQQELKRAGIRFKGDIMRNDTAKGVPLISHHSETLPALLKVMLEDSDNLIADNLAKTLGQRYYEQPGSFRNGTKAIKTIIKAHTGIDLEFAVLADGSGLSRDNRIMASDMMKVITYIYQHDDSLGLMKDLPVAGLTGTLRYRQSVRQAPIKQHLAAKSGSLYGTFNLAGVMTAKSGKPLLVVQFVTNYLPPEKSEDAPAIDPEITQFERTLYTELYNAF